MDEFHYYAEPDRGWAWQVPLLELPQAQFLLMSATLGDVTELADDLTRRTGRETAVVDDAERPVPLTLHLGADAAARDARGAGRAPARRRSTSCTSPRRPRSSTRQSLLTRLDRLAPREADATRSPSGSAASGSAPASARRCRKLLRSGIGVHHAGMLPRYRRLVEQLAQAGLLHGHLRHRHPRRRHQRADPHGAVHRAGEVRRQPAAGAARRGSSCRSPAARAGPASTPPGYVVVQAPEHVIENEQAKAKADAKNAALSAEKQAKRKSKAQLTKPPEGTVVWTEQTFDKLVAGEPEPLVSPDEGRQRDAGQRRRPRGGRLRGAAPAAAPTTTRTPRAQVRLARRALRLARSLVHSGVLTRLDEPDEFGRRYVLTVDLPDGLRAQPAAGALRARGARRARPGVADVHPRHRLGRSRRCSRRRGRS